VEDLEVAVEDMEQVVVAMEAVAQEMYGNQWEALQRTKDGKAMSEKTIYRPLQVRTKCRRPSFRDMAKTAEAYLARLLPYQELTAGATSTAAEVTVLQLIVPVSNSIQYVETIG
jgi:hypothetical protein